MIAELPGVLYFPVQIIILIFFIGRRVKDSHLHDGARNLFLLVKNACSFLHDRFSGNKIKK